MTETIGGEGMSRRNLLVTAGILLVSGGVGVYELTKGGDEGAPPHVRASQTTAEALQPLEALTPHTNMDQSTAPELQAVAQYEKTLGKGVKEAMLFADTPRTTAEATEQAADMAARLREFKRFDITPLVVFEPQAGDAALIPDAFNRGSYDAPVDAYFAHLKEQGIDDAALGTWVWFPEANTPEFSADTTPKLFVSNVARMARLQKKHFPDSRASIMLDSLSYKPGDTNWETGDYRSLKPYMQGLPRGLIDSLGVQGLPWRPPADSPDTIRKLYPPDFFPQKIITEAAKALGTSDIWINTGTFSRMYAGNPTSEVALTAPDRKEILDGIVLVSGGLRKAGYKVTVNMFAGNKANLLEGTDWSYRLGSDDAARLHDFATQLDTQGTTLSLFDSL
jgi:hypothetical protein